MIALTNLISFLDLHSGSLLAVLTAVYVVGTFLMWWEMKETRKRAHRPYIQISLEPQARWGNFFDLIVSNLGIVPVYDLELSINPPDLKTIGDRKLGDLPLFKRKIPVFGINQNLKTLAISYPQFINSSQSKQITFVAKYSSASGRIFIQNFDFDMEVYMNMSASSEKSLNDVAEGLEKIAKQMERFVRNFE